MALRFDTSSERIYRTTNVPSFSSFSALMWFYALVDNGNFAPLFAMCSALDSGIENCLLVDFSAAGNPFATYNPTSNRVYGTNISLSTWYHGAITVNGTGAGAVKAYLNGVLDITASGHSDTSAAIVVANDGYSQAINARLAAVKIYSVVLTPEEVAQEMRQFLPIRTANLNTFLPCTDSVLADNYKDQSGNGYNMTSQGTLTSEDGPPIPWRQGPSRLWIPAAVAGSVGASDGSATVTGVGASLAAASGTATGAAVVSGIGTSLATATGSSSGTSTGAAVGAALFSGVGAAAGSGTAQATGYSTADSIGISAGAGAATGVGASTAGAVGSSAGSGTATGAGAALTASSGTSAGVGTALAIGTSTALAVGLAAGTSTAQADSGGGTAAVGSAAGTSTVSGVGVALFVGVGSAAGVASVAGVGSAASVGVGSTAGLAVAAGIGRSFAAAVGTAAGVGTALGYVPASGVVIPAPPILIACTFDLRIQIACTLSGPIKIDAAL